MGSLTGLSGNSGIAGLTQPDVVPPILYDLIAGTYPNAEFWRSQDNGATWAQVDSAVGETHVFSLVLAANGDLIAGTYPNAEFWRSQDNGATGAQVGNAAGEQRL